MEKISFKERVRKAAIVNSKYYKENFVNKEYLLCSEAYQKKRFYIIKADEGNYLHLLGVNSRLKPKDFFTKCLNDTLEEDDFDFYKRGQSEGSVKGSVRQKIKVLPYMVNMFNRELVTQESFNKNKIRCALATAESTHTLGYEISGRPQTLLRNNVLEKEKTSKVDLIFVKERGTEKFSVLLYGEKDNIPKYLSYIKNYIAEHFYI